MLAGNKTFLQIHRLLVVQFELAGFCSHCFQRVNFKPYWKSSIFILHKFGFLKTFLMIKNFFDERLNEKEKYLLYPCPSVVMLSVSPVFLPQEDSNPSRCTWKHFILPCVLVCHVEVHEMWNKSHLPTLTSCDSPWQPCCCSAPMSAALGSLLRATRWGGTWVMRGAPPCPGRTAGDVLPCPEIPSHPMNAQPVVHSPPERGWWVTLLVWPWCPCLQVTWLPSQGNVEAVARLCPCSPWGAVSCPSHSSSIHTRLLGALALQGARELALCC